MKKSFLRLSIKNKKRVLSISIAMSIVSSPWLSFATGPLAQLLEHALPAHMCRAPHAYPPVDDEFCRCFSCAMNAGCKERHFPSVFCDNMAKLKNEVAVLGEMSVCRKYMPHLEPPISLEECQSDLQYFKGYCNQPFQASLCE